MISKKFRIKRSDYKLFSKSKSFLFNSSLISLSLYKNTIFNEPKFIFTCSKKVSNSAVKRNKLRRQGFSIIREFVTFLKKDYIFHFIYKKGAEKLSFNLLKDEIEKLLRLSKTLN